MNARACSAACLTAIVSVLISTGCFGPFAGRASDTPPPDPRTSFLAQPGVMALPEGPERGLVRLRFSANDFDAQTLKLPAGNYTFEVHNVDAESQIGFFLREPDRFGREGDQHLIAGGGIRRGQSRIWEVTLHPDKVYFYSEPITDSPRHQIFTVAALPVTQPEAAPSKPDLSAPPVPEAESAMDGPAGDVPMPVPASPGAAPSAVDDLLADFPEEVSTIPVSPEAPFVSDAYSLKSAPASPGTKLEGLQTGSIVSEGSEASQVEVPTVESAANDSTSEDELILSPRARALLEAMERADRQPRRRAPTAP
jgi:hypothetical protein